MKATVRRQPGKAFIHSVEIRGHRLVVDEPEHAGGEDQGPTPQELLAASLASCMAVTMEMYAQRKGWEIGPVEVAVEYEPPERGMPVKFSVDLRLPASCTEEQRERLQVIAAKCPVHRTLEGEVVFEDRVTLTQLGEAAPKPSET